jgi:hypothetical protein
MSYSERFRESQERLVELRKAFYSRVRKEGTVTVKCRPFELNGYVRDGVDFDPEYTLVLIHDAKTRGQLFNEEDRLITVYSSFENDCLKEHLLERKYSNGCTCTLNGEECKCPEDEYIGLDEEERPEEESQSLLPEIKERYFTDLVLSWECTIFEEYLYTVRGVLIPRGELRV